MAVSMENHFEFVIAVLKRGRGANGHTLIPTIRGPEFASLLPHVSFVENETDSG